MPSSSAPSRSSCWPSRPRAPRSCRWRTSPSTSTESGTEPQPATPRVGALLSSPRLLLARLLLHGFDLLHRGHSTSPSPAPARGIRRRGLQVEECLEGSGVLVTQLRLCTPGPFPQLVCSGIAI